MQIIVAPSADITVWWYTPRPRNPVWYVHAHRLRRRSGEIDGVEYCILAQLTGTNQPQSVRFTVTPYCNLPSRYLRVFSSKQLAEAVLHTRHTASLAYRLAIGPRSNLWWHQWNTNWNDKLEPFHAH